MSTKEVTTKIAGIFKYPAGKELNQALAQGDEVHLVREPHNEYDKNAIAIYAEGPDGAVQLGYVQAPIALQLVGKELHKAVKGSAWDMVDITFEEAA
jgi:hypothetical protein